MKCKIIKEQEMVNPAYEAAEDKSGIQQRIPIPVGEVLDNKDAWMLCALGVAVPVDDECRTRLNAYLGEPRRKALLEKIKRLQVASQKTKLDAKTQKWLDFMVESYGPELSEIEVPVAAE